jgi:hypothetical protein
MTRYQMAMGADVTIENRSVVREAKATVVWIGGRLAGKELFEIAIQLAHPENIWGMEFPPDDWDQSILTSSAKPAIPGETPQNVVRIETPARSKEKPPTGEFRIPARPPEGSTPKTAPDPHREHQERTRPMVGLGPVPRPAEKPAPKGDPATEPVGAIKAVLPAPLLASERVAPPDAMAKKPLPASPASAPPAKSTPIPAPSSEEVQAAALEAFRRQVEEVTKAALTSLGGTVVTFSKNAGLRLEVNLQNLVNRLEERGAELLNQDFGDVVTRAENSRTSLETLLADARQLQQSWEAELQKAELNIQYAGQQALRSATQEINEKLRGEAERTSSALLDEMRMRLQRETAATVEAICSEVRSRLLELSASRVEEFESQLSGYVDPFKEMLHETMQAFEEKARKDFPQSLQNSAHAALGTLTIRLQEEMEDAMRGFVDRRARDFEADLQQSAVRVMEDSSSQIRKLTADMLQLAFSQLNDRREVAVEQAVESFRRKLANMLPAFQQKMSSPA